jgi:hypothetical protein
MSFSLAWKDFGARFEHIVENIRRHQKLIDDEARAEDIDESNKARKFAREQLEESMREKQTKRKKACAEWLSPADMDTIRDNASGAKTSGTGVWLLSSREMKDWLDVNHDARAIWLSGIPGAGAYDRNFEFLRW